MTLAEIEAVESEVLTAEQIARFLKCDPQGLREIAKNNPEQLGFPVTRIGRTVKIYKQGFLNYVKGVNL